MRAEGGPKGRSMYPSAPDLALKGATVVDPFGIRHVAQPTFGEERGPRGDGFE